MKDDSLPEELTLKNGEAAIEYKEDNLKKLAVYGNIAAVISIQMNEEIENKLYLPKEWFTENQQYFVLKVKGDSMIGANINNGDYVM
ncbi:LexA repressor [Clostridium homopropionicum DSM 5847]|uniref:LexA repressor n=1 Tax=Clostridium homopropionicum DSM 5847 TaxID=1121318 RepID=A0A0L6ZFG6_9CLOT|nr:S24 family peptidase [Clostridium homopropionicum]KOA21548.1 LexA repressor [Clostridium homopropionicum DSM 5847]SFH00313.1 repressor LexA [Clostridium homopropionicum]